MSTFARTIIRNQWRFVHRCEKLVKLVQDSELDPGTVAIIFGHDDQWYVRDKNHDAYIVVRHCPACGIELVREFTSLERLMTLDRGSPARLPELKGLEG